MQRSEKYIWARTVCKMLELVDIHSYYGDSHVLHGISMQVSHGSVVALLGRNGMGKTTTLRCISGLNRPRPGQVIFKGEDISHVPCHLIARKGIGLVPQGRRIFPSLTVEENLTVAARSVDGPESWDLQRVYTLFPILEERRKCQGTSLSGGEQQMLCIGRALMTNAELILMDEPSEGLAPIVVQEVGHIIEQLKTCGLAILLVEQNLRLALGSADFVYVLSNGRVVHEATADAFAGDKMVQDRYLGINV